MFFDPSTPATGLEPAPASSGVAPAHRRRRPATARLQLHPPEDADRSVVERFIRDVYAQHYGARVGELAPTLVTLQADGRILAAAGYRPATQVLFLERYLAAPIEAVLRSLAPAAPARAGIVEVGHLAAVRTGAGRLLMPMLGAHLADCGFEWVVSTATAELRHLFARMGLEPLVLGVADPAVLGPAIAQWGSYYDHHPLVVAGSIATGMARIAHAMIGARS
jgi:hypothetical protein